MLTPQDLSDIRMLMKDVIQEVVPPLIEQSVQQSERNIRLEFNEKIVGLDGKIDHMYANLDGKIDRFYGELSETLKIVHKELNEKIETVNKKLTKHSMREHRETRKNLNILTGYADREILSLKERVDTIENHLALPHPAF